MSTLVRWTARSSWDSAFDDLVRKAFTTDGPVWSPAADIISQGEDVTLLIELPGIREDELDVEVKDRTLVVQGRREMDIAGTIARQEIRTGPFARTFTLPAHVGPDHVKADYRDGILTIAIAGAKPAAVSQRIPVTGLAQADTTEALEAKAEVEAGSETAQEQEGK